MATIEQKRLWQKMYREKNPDKVRESKERWRKANMEMYRKWGRESARRNRDKALERERAYALANPHMVAKKNAARKARLYNVRREPYSRLDIYEKDGGLCCICNELIDLTIPARHKMSFTIQHHVPLSQGGADAPDNLGIAHYSCNSRVGNRLVTNHG